MVPGTLKGDDGTDIKPKNKRVLKKEASDTLLQDGSSLKQQHAHIDEDIIPLRKQTPRIGQRCRQEGCDH